MAFTNCDKCGYRYFTDQEHKCQPMYEVFEVDGEHVEFIHAPSHEEAAEKYCENIDDIYAEGPHERTVLVNTPGQDDFKKFNVNFDICIDYMAQEVK